MGTLERMMLSWVDNSNNETSFTIQWSSDPNFTTIDGSLTAGANSTTAVTGNIARQVWYFRIQANNVLGSSAWDVTGGIQPAAVANSPLVSKLDYSGWAATEGFQSTLQASQAASPLVFLSTFTFGISDWSGQAGSVQTSYQAAMGGSIGAGLMASWYTDDDEGPVNQPAYVTYEPSDVLKSYMANFSFNPNSAVTTGPVDIFTGHDEYGEIFGVQFEFTIAAPDNYHIRGWMLTTSGEEYTDWVNITNAEHQIELDWESDQASSLNLDVDDQSTSVSGDSSMYKVIEARLGPSRGLVSDGISAPGVMAGATQTVYLDEFISLSTGVTTPYIPPVTYFTYMPLVNR